MRRGRAGTRCRNRRLGNSHGCNADRSCWRVIQGGKKANPVEESFYDKAILTGEVGRVLAVRNAGPMILMMGIVQDGAEHPQAFGDLRVGAGSQQHGFVGVDVSLVMDRWKRIAVGNIQHL